MLSLPVGKLLLHLIRKSFLLLQQGLDSVLDAHNAVAKLMQFFTVALYVCDGLLESVCDRVVWRLVGGSV